MNFENQHVIDTKLLYIHETAIPIKKSECSKIMSDDESPHWQWSTQLKLHEATEESWMHYSNENDDAIEEAYGNKLAVMINIGLSRVEIRFSVRCVMINNEYSLYHKQIRHLQDGSTKHRWVRRVLLLDEEKLEMERTIAATCTDDVCAVCLNVFSDEPQNLVQRLQCKHVFHALCVQFLVDRDHTRCPICRAYI